MVYKELESFVGPAKPEAEVKELMERLSEPFDPKYIDWKPQVKSRDGRRAMAAAYADVRAYIDRLNQVVGRQNWAHTLDIRTVDYSGGRSQDGAVKSKVVVTVGVAIRGVGVGVDVGESPTEDPNAFTSAFAQAFKRACVQFGLGRYLYEIESRWYELDEHGQWVKGKEPQLPEWAIPSSARKPVQAVSKPAVRQARQTEQKPDRTVAKQMEGNPVAAAPSAALPGERPCELPQGEPAPDVRLPEQEVRVRGRVEKCTECGGEIQDVTVNGKPYPAAKIIGLALEKYGRPVCASCGVKLKELVRKTA